MELADAVERVMQGEPLESIADGYREELIAAMGLEEDDITENTFSDETNRFMRQLCRHLGERHEEDRRVCVALLEWVRQVEHYEAYDALLTSFRFEGRAAVLRKGRVLFPGPLTAHWQP